MLNSTLLLQASFDEPSAREAMLPTYHPYPVQASFDESLDEMVLGDGPGAAPPEPEPEPFDVASLGELFADPEG